mmetsp:Transcript_39530/g.112727  ORF Transcript_39530/g.112727 Transcript_39530/m.112727 type:complete len:117 (-) Transcript_39530:1168-1518(-)
MACMPVDECESDNTSNTGPSDFGTHTVCAKVTDTFLQYTKAKGNNLSDPVPQYNFPGLKEGSLWCLCASRWLEAHEAGVAPPIYLKRTHSKTLETIDMSILQQYALDAGIDVAVPS